MIKSEKIEEIVMQASDAAVLPVTPGEFVRLTTHASEAAWEAASRSTIQEIREWVQQTPLEITADGQSFAIRTPRLLAKLEELERGA